MEERHLTPSVHASAPFPTCCVRRVAHRYESDTALSGFNTTNGRNLRCELAFHSTGGDAVVSPADPNLVLAAFTNTVPYREVQLNTFMEFSKYLRVSSKGILVSE